MTQSPHGPKHLTCPLHKQPMGKVCHKCPLWIHVRGQDKNTGAEVDRWNCSVAELPLLLIEVASTVRGVDGTLGEFRKENTAVGQALGAVIEAAAARRITQQQG